MITPPRLRIAGLAILAAVWIASTLLPREQRLMAIAAACLASALMHLPAARTSPIAGGTAALLIGMAAARWVEAGAERAGDVFETVMFLQLAGLGGFLYGVARARG